MLQQKNHLAALGLAVSKVSHDLRNMLTSAQLISDRMANVEDPTVKRFAPKLIGSLDRAIEFLSQTLKFGRAQELPPQREKLGLSGLVDEVIEAAVVKASSRITISNAVPTGVSVDADREQLIRVLTNLMRNAIQAIESAPGRTVGRAQWRHYPAGQARRQRDRNRGQRQWPRHSGSNSRQAV